MSNFFGWTYQGVPLERWLGKHEALKSKVKIESNNLATEFAAAERFKIDPIKLLHRPRDERKAIAGYHVGKNALDTMRNHDTKPKPKTKKPGRSRR